MFQVYIVQRLFLLLILGVCPIEISCEREIGDIVKHDLSPNAINCEDHFTQDTRMISSTRTNGGLKNRLEGCLISDY